MTPFVTGTDTDIGKTIISAWLCLQTGASYWKPIQSGNEGPTDRELVETLAGVHTYPEAYKFKAPVSPHLASQLEGNPIRPDQISKPADPNMVIEGAGGVLVPINSEQRIIDLIQQWKTPVIIVARSTLGTINHTCLTIEVLRNHNIPILGVIMNGPLNPDNKQAIEEYGRCQVLAEFPPLKKITREVLAGIPLPTPLLEKLQ
jgi:dethiobiotin synthetase